MASEFPSSLGGIFCPDEGKPDRDVQSAHNKTCRYRRNMKVLFNQVNPGNGCPRGQGGLQDGASLRRYGIRNRRGDTCDTAALEASLTWGELGSLIIDARNMFSEYNQNTMMWVVHHEWPSGTQFTFNCCHHWAIMVIQDRWKEGHFLYSKEGITQRYLLATNSYGLRVIPLISIIWEAHPNVTQPWYAYSAGSVGTFTSILDHLKKIMAWGPPRGYFWSWPIVSWSYPCITLHPKRYFSAGGPHHYYREKLIESIN